MAATEQRGLVADIRALLVAAGDPERGAHQQRYMKSAMPFRGVGVPEVRRLVGRRLRTFRPGERAEWESVVLELWDGATHREERYAALAVARHRCGWHDPASLPLYRHLVTTGAWWDLVDEVAAHLVGGVLAMHRREVTPLVVIWADDPDVWLRRTAVLSQLRHGADTDRALLGEVIERTCEDPSFWLRKAVGWALRQYARTDPDWVLAEVDRLGTRLSPLSRREALKQLS